jgi:methyl-accepting chemotaxis protein
MAEKKGSSMSSQDLIQLHNKASRGEALSSEERALLEKWYAERDREDAGLLGSSTPPQEISVLRKQVNATVSELHRVTKAIQEQVAENEIARQEIATLQKQLAHRTTIQPA